jgi:hypothetical protein
MAEPRRREELSPEDLQQQQGEELPDREALSLVDRNAALPINAAVASADSLWDDLTSDEHPEQNRRFPRRSHG